MLACVFCKLSPISRQVCKPRQLRVVQSKRTFVGKDLKKFYKNVTVTQAEGGKFEVNLDKRKLKTPFGTLFQVPTEALALGVATEWDSQSDTIKRHQMHLTSLCNTAIDNPTHRDKNTVINGILEFVDTDTICYRMDTPPELVEFQAQEWDPLIDWVYQRYGVEIQTTTSLGALHIPDETKDVFRQHLQSYNDWALVGYEQAVGVLKSSVITTALIDRELLVERAIQLSRVEQAFQIKRWGNVEWYHDVDVLDQQARLASAVLFVHLNSTDTRTTFNKENSGRPV